jgi:protein-tyrosine phosphatase
MTGISNRRRMSFAVVFAILRVAVCTTAVRSETRFSHVIFGWFGADFMMVSLAYFMNWPGVFGKTEQGTLRWPSALLMAPILLTIRVVWQLQNTFVRTPLYSEIAPGLFVGRLCNLRLLPKEVSLVIDFTAEFQTPHSIRSKIPTLCVPTLDGCTPDWRKCQQAFELIGGQRRHVYVCCANGHGRSVTFVATWLGKQGVCHSAADAVKLIQAARPSAAPNRDQMSFLTQAFESMKSDDPTETRTVDGPK